ncbi:hypothetical protein [Streptomyces antibioticus]|uniref:hypothetical protein n=1 Tax=Streptomyces antibioticus TaxID=1890 RepID=UPI0036BB4E45
MRGEEPGADDERAGTRWVFAVPAGLLTLVAGFFCWVSLTVRPSGAWDDNAYAGIVLACSLSIAAAGAVVVAWAAPSVRRAVPWWWVSPALVLGVVAGVRWGLVF